MKVFPLLTALSICSLTAAGQSYWPMQEGSRWELRSGNQTMVFEVVRRNGGVFQVKWDNPWVKATFGFRLEGGNVLLESLDMAQGPIQMPSGTAYFDFSKNKGESWSNVLGTMTILQRGQEVNAPAGKYGDTIGIRARDTKKTDTFWTFARDIGPVQFGQGRGAFLLTAYTPGSSEPSTRSSIRDRDRIGGRRGTPPPAPEGSPSTVQIARKPSGVYIGIDANPSPNEGYSEQAKAKRARIAAAAGATFLYYAPKWSELETSPGKYNFAELEHKVSVAAENNWPIALNIRVIDTNNRAMPSAYQKWGFSEDKTAGKLRELIGRIGPKFQGRVRWIQIGNEVNEYFKNRKGEIPAYAEMVNQVMPAVKEHFPGAAFSINFTFFASPALERDFGELTRLCDFASFTYYPLNADLTFRPPDAVPGDIAAMVRAAGGKPVFFQELGYSSSEQLKSSEATQAEFIHRVFAALRQHKSIFASHFVWMSDLPDSVVDDFTKYYKLSGSNNFRAYLATLGYFDKNGRPKEAWKAFEQEAPRM